MECSASAAISAASTSSSAEGGIAGQGRTGWRGAGRVGRGACVGAGAEKAAAVGVSATVFAPLVVILGVLIDDCLRLVGPRGKRAAGGREERR